MMHDDEFEDIDTLPGGSAGDDWEDETKPLNVRLPSCRKPHADDVTARPGFVAAVAA